MDTSGSPTDRRLGYGTQWMLFEITLEHYARICSLWVCKNIPLLD